VSDAGIEGEPVIISIINTVMGILRVRGALADLEVGREVDAITAERAPELRVGIGNTIGIARATGSKVIARVVPDDRDLAGRLIQ
jgi:hypothetical protein